MELGSGARVGPGGLLLPGGQCQSSTAVSFGQGKNWGSKNWPQTSDCGEIGDDLREGLQVL